MTALPLDYATRLGEQFAVAGLTERALVARIVAEGRKASGLSAARALRAFRAQVARG